MTINTMFKTIWRKKEEEETIEGYTINIGSVLSSQIKGNLFLDCN